MVSLVPFKEHQTLKPVEGIYSLQIVISPGILTFFKFEDHATIWDASLDYLNGNLKFEFKNNCKITVIDEKQGSNAMLNHLG